MNFLFSNTLCSFTCVRCKAIVKSPIHGLCEKCHNDDVEKFQKIKSDRIDDFKRVLDMVKDDRDLLLAWLAYIQFSNSPYVSNELVLTLEHLKEGLKPELK